MKHLVKVGKTTKDTESRASELSAAMSLYCFSADSSGMEEGIKWFEKYLQSKNFDADMFKIQNIFHCCVWLEMTSKYSRYEGHLRDILSKYKAVLSPLKNDLISYAVQAINALQREDSSIEPFYTEVGQNFKKML